jgi:hypothetical protein
VANGVSAAVSSASTSASASAASSSAASAAAASSSAASAAAASASAASSTASAASASAVARSAAAPAHRDGYRATWTIGREAGGEGAARRLGVTRELAAIMRLQHDRRQVDRRQQSRHVRHVGRRRVLRTSDRGFLQGR